MAQVPKLQELRREYPNKRQDRVKLSKNKLHYNHKVIDGEFEKNTLSASTTSADVYELDDFVHSDTFEHEQSTFQAHAIHVYSTTEAGLALDAIHQKPDIGAVDHMMYVYRFIDESGEIREGYSDDGEGKYGDQACSGPYCKEKYFCLCYS